MLKIAAAAAAFLAFQGAQASVLIDDFSFGAALGTGQSVFVPGGGTGFMLSGNGTTSCAHIIGCYRDVVIDNSDAGGSTSAEILFRPAIGPGATPTIGSGWELTTNVGSGDKAIFTITYDGDVTTGNLATGTKIGDLSETVGLQFYVKSDGAGGITNGTKKVSIALYDTSGHVLATEFSAFSTFGPTCPLDPLNPDCYILATFNFASEFLNVGAAGDFDFANVSALQAIVNVDGSSEALDFALRTVTAEVPEPATIALAGLALLGLGASSRRRHQ